MICNITHYGCTHFEQTVRTFYGAYANYIKIGIHTCESTPTEVGVPLYRGE